ncbi:MAG: NADH:flavin oxidoreductase [Fibrobacteria bacterium]|nr:NADH:flavin oxidoreductase [Fibrobacteria bacterium]
MTPPRLFESVRIGSHLLRNRIVRSATYEGLADADGGITPAYSGLYRRLAGLGPGAIVTGFAFVSPEGRSMQPRQAGVHDARNIVLWRKMNEEVHRNGSRIFLQIAHAGRQTRSEATGCEVVAPDGRASGYFGGRPRPLREDEIPNRVEQFVRAARIAQEAGFDGVQVHAAHGYLLHQFLTPATNRRRDSYGVDPLSGIGTKFLGEVLGGIRQACGPGFDCWIKVSHGDSLKNGMNPLRFESLLAFLQQQPVDAIEVSYGTMDHAMNIFRGKTLPLDRILEHNPRYRITSPWIARLWRWFAAPFATRALEDFEPGYNLEASCQAKRSGSIPVACVGGFRSGGQMDSAIASGQCDLVSLSRPFLHEPDLVRKLARDLGHEAGCVSCNQCAVMCDTRNPTRCYTGGKHGSIKR